MADFYNNNQNLKGIGVPINFTEEQVNEYIKCKNDPIYFINNYCKIVSLDDGLIMFKTFEYQNKFIKTMHEENRIISMQNRQMGKCLIYNTFFQIRNKKTGEIQKITAEEFHQLVK